MKTEKDNYVHLVDTLLKKKINISKVFAPEHGFRGEADAGEVVKDGKTLKRACLSFHSMVKIKSLPLTAERGRPCTLRFTRCRGAFLYLYLYFTLCNGGLC